MTDDQITVEIWKKTVDVQQHFNDICLRIRNLAITVLTGFIAAIGLSLKDNIFVELFGISVSLAFLSAVGAFFVWLGFFFMDRFWYHQLLVGSVKYGLEIEEKNTHIFGEKGLAGYIGEESPIKIGGRTIHSNGKFHFFYTFIATLLLVVAAILFFNLEPTNTSEPTEDTGHK